MWSWAWVLEGCALAALIGGLVGFLWLIHSQGENEPPKDDF